MTSLLEQIKAKRQQIANAGQRDKRPYKFKNAKTTIRILPTWNASGEGLFYRDFAEHWIKNREGKVLAVVADSGVCNGVPCPVKPMLWDLVNSARNEAEKKHYKDMIGSSRILVNALVLDDPDVNPNEPELINFSTSLFDDILAQMETFMEKYGKDCLSLEEGYDFIVSYNKNAPSPSQVYGGSFAPVSSKVDISKVGALTDLDAFVERKLADSERAINAVKSISNDRPLSIVNKSTEYSSGTRVIESKNEDYEEHMIVNNPKEASDAPNVNVNQSSISDDEIKALFDA